MFVCVCVARTERVCVCVCVCVAHAERVCVCECVLPALRECVCVSVDDCSQVSVIRPTVTVQVCAAWGKTFYSYTTQIFP